MDQHHLLGGQQAALQVGSPSVCIVVVGAAGLRHYSQQLNSLQRLPQFGTSQLHADSRHWKQQQVHFVLMLIYVLNNPQEVNVATVVQLFCNNPSDSAVFNVLQSITLLNQWRRLWGLERPWQQWEQRRGAPILLWRTGICCCFHGTLIVPCGLLRHLWQHPTYCQPLKKLGFVHTYLLQRINCLLLMWCIWNMYQ